MIALEKSTKKFDLLYGTRLFTALQGEIVKQAGNLKYVDDAAGIAKKVF